MLAVIDLGLGNLGSVVQAFSRVGADLTVTSRPEDLDLADGVVLPGVGAFGDGMTSLRDRGLVAPIRRYAQELRKPLLGICLGMQLMAESGDEHGHHDGLGLVRGRVTKLKPVEPGQRVPNMGWCDVAIANRESRLFSTTRDGDAFYFAHSYGLDSADPAQVVATIDYGGPLAAAIEHANLFGVQFHPEKSQDAGLNILAAFLTYVDHPRRPSR